MRDENASHDGNHHPIITQNSGISEKKHYKFGGIATLGYLDEVPRKVCQNLLIRCICQLFRLLFFIDIVAIFFVPYLCLSALGFLSLFYESVYVRFSRFAPFN